MSPIKDLRLTYRLLNEEGTFSDGDIIIGSVVFNLTKDTKMKSLFVKIKGDAHVQWSEGDGDSTTTYKAHRRYFKIKEFLIGENDKGTVLSKGLHDIKFFLPIPNGDLPSSFKGKHGNIIYMLEAKISRSWRWPSKVKDEIQFVSRFFPCLDQVMHSQTGSVNKETGVFSKGQIQMTATVEKKVCSPGDTISIVAKICNSSSKKVKPKFSLLQKTVYRVNDSTKVCEKVLFKMVGDILTPNSENTATCQLQVPADAVYTLHNCDILSIEYFIKVYVDIKFAVDPKVLFPLVVVPHKFTTIRPEEAAEVHPQAAAWASNFLPLTTLVGLRSTDSGATYGFSAGPSTSSAGQYPDTHF
ncbi:arrestin domain-containing protein 3-like [Parambassis ranga]|uniref:Arrestin domain-containing protein 3-like n=1 Tax=Parambassis ranga TaxID=210632 RepID=A0A6P7J179_9TELE|nr:arrestin domain-containing protein 3-like [Parambassis ranga]